MTAMVLPPTGPVPTDLARRVRAVIGADEDVRCRVVDRRVTPGERSHVLFEVGRRYVVGSSPGDLSNVVMAPMESDEELPGLRLIHDPAALRALVDSWSSGPPSVRCRADLLRYRPGRRATFMVHSSSVGSGSRLVRRRMIVKVYHDRAKALAVHTEMAALATERAAPDLMLARPLGIDAAHDVVGQEVLEGVALGPMLAAMSGRTVRGIDRAARALAALHRLPTVSSRSRSLDRAVEKLERRTSGLAVLHPFEAAPLIELIGRLVAAIEPAAISPARRTLVHGDAKADQFLIRPDAMALLDFDHCGVGDPAADVADFVGKLRQRSLASGRPDPVTAGVMGRRFVATYVAANPVEAGFDDRITLNLAFGFARRALRALQRAPISPLVPRLAAEGHRELDRLFEGDRKR